MSDMFERERELDREIKNNYTRMSGGINTCPKCNSDFKVSILNDNFPNRENELVDCPYCPNIVGYIRTSGIVKTSKIN